MRRTTRVFLAGLAMVTGAADAGQPVVAHDGTPIENAVIAKDRKGISWIRVGAGAPFEIAADSRGDLRLPDVVTAQYVVMDAISGEPVRSGSLRWQIAEAPIEIKRLTWRSADGRLDLICRGNERMVVTAPGYAPTPVLVVVDGRRHPVLLQPQNKMTVALEPAAKALMWLAREDQVNFTNRFNAVADVHVIEADGVLEVRRLDLGASYVGVVVPQGKVPVQISFHDLPQELNLQLEEGLAVSGTVRDEQGQPLAGALVEAYGVIAELDDFRYRHFATSGIDGSFNLAGFLPGKVRVRACADLRACSETTISMVQENATEPVVFDLAPGRDLVLIVENEIGDRVTEAIVQFNDLVYRTDSKGELQIQGVMRETTIPVKIYGRGFREWEGSFSTDRERVIITVPGGAIIEQRVLSGRRFAAADVFVWWQGYHPSGRESESGDGDWDAEHGIARATGLKAGTYALKVKLPGSATLTSERADVAPGEEVVLAPVVPNRGLALSGRVLESETLQPIAGAIVSCEPGSPSVFRLPYMVEMAATTSTDTDGVFLLEGLDPGPCRAIVKASGFATWRLDGVEPDEVGFDLGDVEMDAGLTIVGRVYDRNERPISGAKVEISEDAAYAYFPETTVRTNHEGYFRAERLPVGRWLLTAKIGGDTAREMVRGCALETVEADLVLGGIRIEGEVWLGDSRAHGGTLVLTTDGTQAPGVVVMVRRGATERQFFGVDQQPMRFAVTPDGRFAGSGLVAGRYNASYTSMDPGAAPVTKVLVVPRVQTFQCAIQYGDAVVDGFVVDDGGLPVAGASVTASAGDGIQEAIGFADGDGRFSVRGLEPGRLVLIASHTEFAPSNPVELDLRSGYTEGPVVLELLPSDGATILLTVNTLAGSSGGAPVYLVGPRTETGLTDAGGFASFSGVTAGSYRPCGFAYGGATGCGPNLAIDDGDELHAQLDLGRGGYVNIFTPAAKSMAAHGAKRGPSVRVMTTDGVDLSSLLIMASPPHPIFGGVRVGPLQADDYSFSVDTHVGQRQGRVSVREGEAVELDLR